MELLLQKTNFKHGLSDVCVDDVAGCSKGSNLSGGSALCRHSVHREQGVGIFVNVHGESECNLRQEITMRESCHELGRKKTRQVVPKKTGSSKKNRICLAEVIVLQGLFKIFHIFT